TNPDRARRAPRRAAAHHRTGLLRGPHPERDRAAHRRSAGYGQDAHPAGDGEAVRRVGGGAPVTCAEFKDLAGALALDALDEEERAAALAHLAQAAHEGCHEALARARTTAGLLSGALADVEPSPLVWRRIASRLNPRRRWAVASGWLAAAAA